MVAIDEMGTSEMNKFLRLLVPLSFSDGWNSGMVSLMMPTFCLTYSSYLYFLVNLMLASVWLRKKLFLI